MPEKELCINCWWMNNNIEVTGDSHWDNAHPIGLCPACNERAVVRYTRLKQAWVRMEEYEDA